MGKGIARVSGTVTSDGSVAATATLASVTAQDNPSMRWQDTGTALHAVISFVPLQSGTFVPTNLTAWLDYGDGVERWQGWLYMASAGQTLYIGAASATNGALVIDTIHVPTTGSIYPPVTADGSWALTVAVGTIDSAAAIPSGAVVSTAFTVAAPLAPAATAASGAYVDAITYAAAGGGAYDFGWGHIYAALPLEDPNFWFASFTLQTGTLVGSTFTPGGVHAIEVGFADWDTDSDHSASMARIGTTEEVYVLNANQWAVPSDGNTCHRIRLYVTSRLGLAGTTTLQQCWSSGVGISTAGTADHQDLVVDASMSNIQASTIAGSIAASQIGSVNASSITGPITASQITSVTAGQITGTLTSGQIGSVAATTITGSIAAAQIGSVNATAISGSITSGQISSITAGSITGVIVTAQLEAGILNAVSLFSAGLLPLQTVSSLPTLPNAGYPVGCTVSNTADGKLYRNVAGAWSSSAAASDVTGTLTASQIASVNTSSLVGLVTAGQINTIATSQLTGTINSTQISSVAATTITGSITAGQIASVYTSALSGYISAGQIGSVNASSVSGTLAWNQIGSINANTITVNQITAGQIASVNAGSIQAGTISASISISSPTISGGSLSGTSISIATSGGTVAINGTSYGVSVTATTGSASGFSTTCGSLSFSATPTLVTLTDTTFSGSLTSSGFACSGYGFTAGYNYAGIDLYYGGYNTSLTSNSLQVGNVTCITNGTFVGAGVNCPSYGVGCAGVNPYVGGVQYYGASFTFYDQGGTLHTVKGGVLVS